MAPYKCKLARLHKNGKVRRDQYEMAVIKYLKESTKIINQLELFLELLNTSLFRNTFNSNLKWNVPSVRTPHLIWCKYIGITMKNWQSLGTFQDTLIVTCNYLHRSRPSNVMLLGKGELEALKFIRSAQQRKIVYKHDGRTYKRLCKYIESFGCWRILKSWMKVGDGIHTQNKIRWGIK